MGSICNLDDVRLRHNRNRQYDKEFDLFIEKSIDKMNQNDYIGVIMRRLPTKNSPFRLAQWGWDNGCNNKFTNYDNFNILTPFDEKSEMWKNQVEIYLKGCRLNLVYKDGTEFEIKPKNKEEDFETIYYIVKEINKLQILSLI